MRAKTGARTSLSHQESFRPSRSLPGGPCLQRQPPATWAPAPRVRQVVPRASQPLHAQAFLRATCLTTCVTSLQQRPQGCPRRASPMTHSMLRASTLLGQPRPRQCRIMQLCRWFQSARSSPSISRLGCPHNSSAAVRSRASQACRSHPSQPTAGNCSRFPRAWARAQSW